MSSYDVVVNDKDGDDDDDDDDDDVILRHNGRAVAAYGFRRLSLGTSSTCTTDFLNITF